MPLLTDFLMFNSGYLVGWMHHGGAAYRTDTLPRHRPYPFTNVTPIPCVKSLFGCDFFNAIHLEDIFAVYVI